MRGYQRAAVTHAIFVALCLLFPAVASAQSRWQPALTLSGVTIVTDTISPGATRTYSTAGLSVGCDTVLHLVDNGTGAELAMNDDASATTVASAVIFTNGPSTRVVRVVLRSFNNATRGTANLLRDGISWLGGRSAAGNSVRILTGVGLSHETTFVANGASGAAMLGLDAAGHLVSWDLQGSGVGLMARLPGSAALDSIVLFSAGSPGRVNLMTSRTTAGSDADGDGLDDLVEAELGTCSSVAACAFPATFTPADTDHDGLSDGQEVLGTEDLTNPALLPLWGANPLHKDVFVEVDYEQNPTGATPILNPFGVLSPLQMLQWIVLAQQPYSGSQAGEVLNPDGLGGIRLHVDVGAPCAVLPYAPCGNWGGGGTPVPTGTSRVAARATRTMFSANRNGIFHYAISRGGGGGGNGDQLGFTLDVGGSGNRAAPANALSFVHELGHNLGLHHFGHKDWDGGSELNGKLNYRSIMNYAFSGFTAFSHGTNLVVLNSSAAREFGVVPGPCSSPSLAVMMAASPSNLLANDDACAVDMNRDGSFSGLFPPYPRSPTTWSTWSADNALSADLVDQVLETYNPTRSPIGTPSMLRVSVSGGASRLYLFEISTTGTAAVVRYRHGLTGGLTSASCPNGDGQIPTTAGGAGCMNWQAWQTVSLPPDIESISAAAWSSAAPIVLVYSRRGGQLFETHVTGLSAESSSQPGQLNGWTTPVQIDSGLTPNTEVELSVLPVSQRPDGGPVRELWAVYLKNDLVSGATVPQYHARRTSSSAVVWSPNWVPTLMLDQAGLAIPGAIGADLTQWPAVEYLADYADRETSCGAFPTPTGLVAIRCRDRDSDLWTDLSSAVFGGAGQAQPKTVSKPGLAYHVLRQTSGAPLFASYSGQFWLVVVQPRAAGSTSLNPPDLLISQAIVGAGDPVSTPWTFPKNVVGKWGTGWSYAAGSVGAVLPATAGPGVNLFEDLFLGALKGAWVDDIPDGRADPPKLRFVPIADGSVNVDLHDGNDFQVMERGICRSIQSDRWCGTAPQSVFGY